ncbi:hypothetical protein HK100_012336 [Physocladia obscura]|uniref:Serine aminopeptidase S33 domain-containing protein n=1 Tax=Physocladia obscura TaxID=109957 RepID=A0AAD5T0I0_9FUNG|nr:hypothetical protein HK100_012336 [Physocladia obscura]
MTTSTSKLDAKKLAAIKRDKFDIEQDDAPGSYFAATADGHQVYYNIWKPTGPVKARILAFHGLGEHVSRYEHVFTRFAESGILVKGMDWRGHGRTVQKNKDIPGFAHSFTQVFHDMIQLSNLSVDGVADELNLPTFVVGFGHSMGGLLALAFVENHRAIIKNYKGVISQCPAIAPGKKLPGFLEFIIRLLGGVIPKVTQPNSLEADGLCSDEEIVVKYFKDPLNHGMISMQLAKDMIKTADALQANAKSFVDPIIMYHNTRDRFTSAQASQAWFNQIASADKTYKAFTEEHQVEHEIHNEPSVNDSIITDYIAWINERI